MSLGIIERVEYGPFGLEGWRAYEGLCGRLHRYDPDNVYCSACLTVEFKKVLDHVATWVIGGGTCVARGDRG